MKITRDEISAQVKTIWPHLVDGLPWATNIAIADEFYWAPRLDQLSELWNSTLVWQYQYNAEYMDCDDFSLLMHAGIVRDRYKQIQERGVPEHEWHSWAVGQCWGNKFRGQINGHAINIAITSDVGVVLIEPQSTPNRINLDIWKANNSNDAVFFIKM